MESNNKKRIRGQKAYLASMEVGESRIYEGPFPWRNMQLVAAWMKPVYGCQFKFRTKQGVRMVTRVS